MDVTILKIKYPQLLEYLHEQGASKGTLYNYQREIRLMLNPDSDISGMDCYCQYVEQTYNGKGQTLCSRLACIKRIWRYVINDEKPKFIAAHQRKLTDEYTSLLEICRLKSKELRHKDKTTLDYIDAARCFLYYLQEKRIYHLKDVTEITVQEYFTDGANAKRGRTISGRLRRFTLMCKDAIGLENAHRLSSFIPVIPNKVHIYPDLSDEESDSIEKTLFDNSNQLTDLDRAVGCLAFFLGLRCSDIINLTKENVDFKRKTFNIIQQKTTVPMALPMPTICSNAIVTYIKNSRPKSLCPNIFVQVRTGQPLTRRELYNISNNILMLAGVPIANRRMRGMHLYRHHFASSLISHDTDISIASALLGHTNPKSTFVYLGTDINKLRSCSLQMP